MRLNKMLTEMEEEADHNCYSEPREDRVVGIAMTER